MADIIVDTSSDLDIAVRIRGPKGDTGDSAYKSWLSLGNTGTVQDFLDSLKAPAVPLSDQVPALLSSTPTAGASDQAARGDHAHKLPSASDVGAEPVGSVASAMSQHLLNADPHTQYAKGAAVSSSFAAVATLITGLQTANAGLSTLVDTKASSASVAAVQSDVDGVQADVSALTTTVNTKASITSVNTVQTNVDSLSTIVSTKADTAALTATSNTLQFNIDNLATTVGTKEPAIAAGTTGQYWRGDKTFQALDKSAVGLPNVDNTSDTDKPISNAQAIALTLKADISNLANMSDPSSGAGSIGSGIGTDLSTAKIVLSNLAALQALPVPALKAGRTLVVSLAGYTSPGDGGEGDWYWSAPSNEVASDMVVLPTGNPAAGRWKRSYPGYLRPEFFGAVGDYNFGANTGTVNTTALQRMFNWASKNGSEIRPLPGQKYLTDTLYLYYDATLNPGWTGNAGRTKIVGQANGYATGALEATGCAFVHVNGSAKPLIELKGVFSVELPTGMGGYFSMEDFNLVGGNQTTHVLNLQGSQGSIFLKNYTVKVQNPAGNGITEATTWETLHMNGLIRGGASGTGSWTGTGLNICSDGSGGQINMKTYLNVDVYRMGYGIQVGRGTQTQGTFGPLIFQGGQTSLSDQHGMVCGGGILGLTSIGQQHEQARLNGLRIDSGGANDLPRQIKFIGTYFTQCGKIQDGSYNEFSIHCVDGVNVEIDSPIFQNVSSGVACNTTSSVGFLLRRPLFKTILPYGVASGRGIEMYGSYVASNRIKVDTPEFDANFSTNVVDTNTVIQLGDVGGRVSVATLTPTPVISLGGVTNTQSARILNFNHASAQTITSILGGTLYQELLITFSTVNTTIQNNGTTIRLNGSNFTPSSSSSILRLVQAKTGVWTEVARSL